MPAGDGPSPGPDGLSGGVARPLLFCPDPDLLRPCEPAGYLTATELASLAADLVASLRASGGEGLSAPQIGVARRLVALGGADGKILVLADPDLLARHGPPVEAEEQCLSWPGGSARLARPEAVTVGWYDLNGIYRQGELQGPPARVLQRQLDILDGRFIGGM